MVAAPEAVAAAVPSNDEAVVARVRASTASRRRFAFDDAVLA